jgi:spermidine/putrescine transport system ATP-binding protein
MGEVNMLAVERINGTEFRLAQNGQSITFSAAPATFTSGQLVLRPELVRIGDAAAGLPNRLQGTLFNEYSLGSRVQYQVRVPEVGTWVVERLRDEPFAGQLDTPVQIGWRAQDGILVED